MIRSFIRKHSSAGSRRSRRAGFTLIEILAATAIMVIITGFVFMLTTNVLSSWSSANSALSGNYEAKIALDKLSQDLESMIVRRDGRTWFVAEESTTVPGSMRLMFYSSVPDRPGSDPSDVCAVEYEIHFQNIFDKTRTGQGERVFALYRTIATPRDTFDTALTLDSPKEYWDSEDVDSGETEHLLAHNVAAIRIYISAVRNNGAQVNAFLKRLVIGNDRQITTITNQFTAVKSINYIDIHVGVLGEEGARAFARDTELPGGLEAVTQERIYEAIDRYGTWHSRRVVLPSAPF